MIHERNSTYACCQAASVIRTCRWRSTWILMMCRCKCIVKASRVWRPFVLE